MTASERSRVAEAAAKAVQLHDEGYNCAESVLGGVLSQIPSEPLGLRVATGFGGGIGRTGDICGAITGAVMAVSWVRGRDRPDDKESYARCAETVRGVLAGFRGQYGALLCSDLTGYDLSDPAVLDRFSADAERREKCAGYVKTAALLAAGALVGDRPRPAGDPGAGTGVDRG